MGSVHFEEVAAVEARLAVRPIEREALLAADRHRGAGSIEAAAKDVAGLGAVASVAHRGGAVKCLVGGHVGGRASGVGEELGGAAVVLELMLPEAYRVSRSGWVGG